MTFGSPGHWLLRQAVKPGASAFRRASQHLESTQRRRLDELLRMAAAAPHGHSLGVRSDWAWEDFSRSLPITTYRDWGAPIQRSRKTGQLELIASPLTRYQPTSGSSAAIKWIPYTRRFLTELDSALSPWLQDLYANHPGTRSGYHYWSLSWLPEDMRAQSAHSLNDDMQLLSAGKRWLASQTQAVPDAVSLTPTSDDSLFATIALLAAQPKLTAISVWSPTFALGLLEKLSLWQTELAEVIAQGHWGSRNPSLGRTPAPKNAAVAALLREWDGKPAPAFFKALWPALALVSAWDTAAARPWAAKLSRLLPHAAFQGKGLWATEGVVTIPIQATGQADVPAVHVLAANSHVYEFVDEDTGDILPPWDLEPGQTVSPLLTTGSGLLRYQLGDKLHVTGHLNQLPMLHFLGREDTTDLVGEKISVVLAQQLLDNIHWPAGILPVVILAVSNPPRGTKPGYVLIAEATPNRSTHDCQRVATELADRLENALHSHFHYRLARQLGQLDAARCLCSATASHDYTQACQDKGMIQGNIKLEPLRAWTGKLPGC